MAIESLQQELVGHRLAPVRCHLDHIGSAAARDLGDAHAEEAGLGHHCGVAGLEEVGEAGLHAGGARAVERQHQAVGHAPSLAQQVHYLEQDQVQLGVEMPQQRPLHGLEHRGLYVGGTGATEEPLGRVERREIESHSLQPASGGVETQPKIFPLMLVFASMY